MKNLANRRELLAAVHDAYARQGWNDHDRSVREVVECLERTRDADKAASVPSRDMLTSNGIDTSQLAKVLDQTLPIRDVSTAPSADVIVLTAIDHEFESCRTKLSDTQRVETEHGTIFTTGYLGGSGVVVYLAQIGPGNLGAAVEVTAAVNAFAPTLILFVGVAGGLNDDLVVGDVVVASSVHYYESGKSTADGFLARPLGLRSPHRVTQLVQETSRSFSGSVQHKPIAAGEQLIAFSGSQVAEIIREHSNDSAAVDMESGGVYDAAHRLQLPALAIRAISDLIGDKSGSGDARNQPLAAEMAASFMDHFLQDEAVVKFLRGTVE